MLDSFEIFNVKTEFLYDEIKKKADYSISFIKEFSMDEGQMETKVSEIFNNYFEFPQLILGDEKKDKSFSEMSINEASALIGNGFSFSVSSNTTPITTLSYTISFTGGKEAIITTVNKNKIQLRGRLSNSSINLHYFFQGSDIDTHGARIKHEKDSLLNLLVANNADIQEFSKNKRSDFLSYIKDSIESKLRANKKYLDDLDKF